MTSNKSPDKSPGARSASGPAADKAADSRAATVRGEGVTPGRRARRVLITGGAGFLGGNAPVHMIGAGWQVTLLDNLSRPGTDRNLKWLTSRHPHETNFVHEDLRNA